MYFNGPAFGLVYHVFGLDLGLEAQVLRFDLGYVFMTPTLVTNILKTHKRSSDTDNTQLSSTSNKKLR